MVLPKKSREEQRAACLAPKLYTVFDPPGDPGLSFEIMNDEGELVPEPSLTEQAHKDACDINLIMAKFARTGELPNMIKQNPQYGDFAAVPSYLDAMNIVCKAQEQFESLDAAVRKRFDNDPASFLAFATNPENKAELGKMGLLTPEALAALQAPVGASGPAGGPTASAPTAPPEGASTPSSGTSK